MVKAAGIVWFNIKTKRGIRWQVGIVARSHGRIHVEATQRLFRIRNFSTKALTHNQV
jgi:hypothetical protein